MIIFFPIFGVPVFVLYVVSPIALLIQTAIKQAKEEKKNEPNLENELEVLIEKSKKIDL
jgi:hypothetical protein